MLAQQINHSYPQDWRIAAEVWNDFADKHPQLRLKIGKWAMHNFFRSHRDHLRHSDVIRLVRGKFWIADAERFGEVAFSCATGVKGTATPTQPEDCIRDRAVGSDKNHLSLVIDPPCEIVSNGLTPKEYLRMFGNLHADIAEPVIDQLEKLRTVALAAAKSVPGCFWNSEHLSPQDAQWLQELLVALHQVNQD